MGGFTPETFLGGGRCELCTKAAHSHRRRPLSLVGLSESCYTGGLPLCGQFREAAEGLSEPSANRAA